MKTQVFTLALLLGTCPLIAQQTDPAARPLPTKNAAPAMQPNASPNMLTMPAPGGPPPSNRLSSSPGKTEAPVHDPLRRGQIVSQQEALLHLSPASVVRYADSLFRASGILLKDASGQPVDLVKAVGANQILLLPGEAIYRPTGASSRKASSASMAVEKVASEPKPAIQ